MTALRIFNHKMFFVVCLAAFLCGCEQQAKQPSATTGQPKQQIGEPGKTPAEKAVKPSVKPEPKEAVAKISAVKLALKPSPGQQTAYKTITHVRRSIKWEGPVPPKDAFEQSFNEDTVETVFTQRVENVDSNGIIKARVTIDALKYVSIVKNQTSLDFDSARPSDVNSPLAKLIGQSYTIELEPNNNISSVSDVQARQFVQGKTLADRAAQGYLTLEGIRERHSTLLLPPPAKESVRPGSNWRTIRTFSFGMMGLKSYEKIYTLKAIQDTAGNEIAVIDMNAIPSSEVEAKFRDQQPLAGFTRIFDTNETYVGSGEVDLTAGRINNYNEKLYTHWITAIPAGRDLPADSNEPVVLTMAAIRSYSLEKIK
jgi:hypothetical protein